jgi:hypothetical protein
VVHHESVGLVKVGVSELKVALTEEVDMSSHALTVFVVTPLQLLLSILCLLCGMVSVVSVGFRMEFCTGFVLRSFGCCSVYFVRTVDRVMRTESAESVTVS